MSAETLPCDPVLRHGWDDEFDAFKIAIIKIECKGTAFF